MLKENGRRLKKQIIFQTLKFQLQRLKTKNHIFAGYKNRI
jgi:hypothetical protein